jgi:hypothetical protein
MYVGFTTTTQAAVKGRIAFWTATNLGNGTYTVTGDAQPSTAVPTYIAGILINVITSTNFGWIQVAGIATVSFDSGTLTAIAAGNWVTAKVSATLASSADVGAAAGVVTLAAQLGVAIAAPVSNTASTVILTRGNFMGRI